MTSRRDLRARSPRSSSVDVPLQQSRLNKLCRSRQSYAMSVAFAREPFASVRRVRYPTRMLQQFLARAESCR